ncbi:eukaryotic translation initiation factor 4 gamma 1-like isoform X8 [Penaeus monodon]|uniref:eukaryotic translation initiation factor 4 gamma 1-like isoform X8 n=1 Tax=Penaeus monodon TaxID=6687 RepID=UPI0018A77582|nr:eukaryotic translation initiation factor 4 gamma 1-like isoform X8 [Penaeus monodon]
MPGNVRNSGQNESHRPPITSASRTKSLDCLADKSDKTSEYVPSRITRTQPKIKTDAMQFVKPPSNFAHNRWQRSQTGPAGLYKSATEQIKKAEAVKAMRKHLIAEEEDWQQQPSSSSQSKSPYDEDTDWQTNLDKWKSSRRKRNEDALERVIEIKKNEQEEELNRTRRKSKTFSEMQEEKTKRGRRYNLVVHDDDNNDLADLGLSTVKSSSSLYDGQEDNDVKDLDQDNKDAKSDAGFCTGSDTGSDGVFAEDNISDTSSALGDKKETHDSLLDTGVSKEEEPRINGHGSSLTSDILNTNNANLYTEEYTYDKAIEGYKQYAENTAKKRTSSITSLNSNTSFTKEDERKDERPRLNGRSPSPAKSNKLEEKLNFFTKEMVKESRTSPEPRVIMREKSPKVDVGKRRSMFEMGEPLISQNEREQKQANRRSLEVPGSLRNKVASFENLDMDTPKVRGMTPNIETNLKSKVKSFENLDTETTKVRGVTPTRDTKFREKLASFAAADTESQTVRKKTPERDVNFHKKLASFTSIENGEEEKCVERKTIPLRDPTLKNKIASFEQLEQAAEAYSQPPREEPVKNRDRSVSLENLDEPPPVKEVMRPAVSMGNMGLMRRAPSTPYMVVDLDKTGVEEESCIREKRPVVSDEQESAGARDQAKRSTIYETIEKCQVVRDVESAPMFSIFQYLSPEVNAQVFEIASKLEETPLLGSPTLRDPSVPLPEPPVQEQDSFEGAKPYTDEDINEVISDYEQVGSVYEEASEHVENIYENITEEPVYENIYEKVDDEIQGEIEEPINEPHYQTLEEVREEVSASVEPAPVPPSPPQQVASKPPAVIEPPEDEPFTRENSTRRIKKELWRRRSDFLGTSSQYIEEEPTVKPPPDLSELLRQEREAERIMAESQRARTPIQETLSKAEIARREKEIIESLERSEQLKQQQQQQQPQQPPAPQQLQNSQPPPPQGQKRLEPSPKPEIVVPPLKIPQQPEAKESAASKPEPEAAPAKQASSKAAPAPASKQKEKEPTPEPQPVQGKRGRGVPREETTPARETVEEPPAQPQQPQLPSQPQKAATPPAAQNATKPTSQPVVQPPKEKTPELAQPVKSQLPPVQKPASAPSSKEATPQPESSPSPPEEVPSDRASKEREVNSIEREVNNVHDEEEKKDDGPQLKYNYKDDQWSPVNPDGKRQYDRRFLLELQNNPLSLKKPESLPNLEVVRDGPGRLKPFDRGVGVSHGSSGPDFTPDYFKSTVPSKRGVPGRNSQQRREPGGGPGSRNDRGGSGRGQSKVIIIPLSTGRETKLKTTENAWKPSVKESNVNDEEAQTIEVVKRMRGILNKLTPEKFEKLVGTVNQMPIDTTERLSAVIDLIFEKAVDEQGFSSTYAQMCQVLSKMSVRGEGSDSSNSGKSEVKFRNLIINKCQKEFEKDNMEEFKATRRKEIDECSEAEKKQELLMKLDYDETKLRKRSVGNIRFIGELYKLRMLTSPIMMRIIGTLLEKRDEESLECLCKLLTTIGKLLETQCNQQPKAMQELDKHFGQMEKIVNDRLTNSRVRFLMMDVIDLRRNKWVPRREDNKPKTKAQVHEEAKREEIEQQIALASTPNRRDDRRDDRDRKRSRDNRGPPMSEDGWNTVASTKNRASFDSSRLKNTFINRPGASEGKEVTLRGTGFSNWARGSSGGGLKDHDETKQESNRFNVLGDSMGNNSLLNDNRRVPSSMGGNRLAPGGGPPRQGVFSSKSMPPPSNDKESALSAVKKFVGPDRSKSTSRPESRDNSVPRETGESLKGSPNINSATAEKFAIAIIEEFTHNNDPEEAKLCVKEKFSTSTIKYFVQVTLDWVLDRDSTKRRMVGQFYHDLIVEKLLSVDQFLEGGQETLPMTEDFAIDIPQVCDYFGEIFAPCLNDNAVSLQRLWDLSRYAENKSADVFASILAKAAKIISPNKVADLWNSSGLSWSSIVPPGANVEEFLAKRHVEFTVDRSKSGNQGGWNPQKVEAEIIRLFKRATNEEIFSWIDANIGKDVKSSKFIRALVTALVESQAMTSNDGSSIRVTEDFEEKLKKRLAVVLKYVDSSDKLELQCIYALQAISVKHQHPPGLLEKCFNAFYDSDVVSEEAFDEWAKSVDPEEQEGKGVCVNLVKSFMRWLKEAEVEGETHT